MGRCSRRSPRTSVGCGGWAWRRRTETVPERGHMPLIDVDLPVADGAVPADVRTYLAEAERRIERFQRAARVPAFVPSDFERVYQTLKTVDTMALAPGR